MDLLAPIHSSLLYWGEAPFPESDVDIEVVQDPNEVHQLIDAHPFKVLVLHLKNGDQIKTWSPILRSSKSINQNLQIVVVYQKPVFEEVLKLYNQGLADWVFESNGLSEKDLFFQLLQRAMEKYGLLDQESQKAILFNEQIEKLSQLKKQLQVRIDKRHKYLERSQKKLAMTNEQTELLHSSLIAVQQAQSVSEMEKLLYNTLEHSLFLEWIKILFSESSNIQNLPQLRSQFKLLELPIFSENKEVGKIIFSRDSRRPFRPLEEELLIKVTEAVSLAISRLVTLKNSEDLKAQWETTFDAFSEPLCLVDQDNRILRSNHAMVVATGRPYQELLGKNPFVIMQIFTQNDLENQVAPFRERVTSGDGTEESIYEILCQKLTNTPHDSTKIMVFRDVTEETRLEKQALESSKMAELGIIGSSIAHELNNPIGGMLNFLQLIKMDLKQDDPLFADINEMELATRRCKEIIENLLGFARQQDDQDTSHFLLTDSIEHSLKLVEIQTKSMGIQVEIRNEIPEVKIEGNKNQMVQALRNILQNSIEAIGRNKEEDPKLVGKIELDVESKNRQILVTIRDNGDGIPKESLAKIFNPLFSLKKDGQASGLGLTVAFQIINRHGGTLEISSPVGSGTAARISMKSPEIKGSSQVFDAKI